jgi:hypothetical protein
MIVIQDLRSRSADKSGTERCNRWYDFISYLALLAGKEFGAHTAGKYTESRQHATVLAHAVLVQALEKWSTGT